MARTFKIYKKDALDTPVVEGASPLQLTGLTANTQYTSGDYVISAIDSEKEGESAKVAVPAFKTLLPAPAGLADNASTATALKMNWTATEGAQAYVIHYIKKADATAEEMIDMWYSETPAFELTDADAGEAQAGFHYSVAVQAYDVVAPSGSTPVEKARALHDGEFTGSAWSSIVQVTLPSA